MEDKDFSIAGKFGKGKIFLFGHTILYQNRIADKPSHKKFLQNIVKWMCGSKPNIVMGLLH